MRDITIKTALNGYLVRVGCQRVVFNNRETMLRALNDYLENPNKIEEMYTYGSINSKQLGFERDPHNRSVSNRVYEEYPEAARSSDDAD